MSFVTSILIASTVLFAATETAPAKKPKMSAAEAKAFVAARLAADGGFVNRPVKGKVVRIKLETDKIARADVEKVAESARQVLRVAIEVVGKGEDPASKVGAFVALVEQGEKAPTLLCAPEDYWATVNVTRLLAGNPEPQVLKMRILTELWRGLAYALGAANSMQQPSVMRPIRSVGELDSEKFGGLSQQSVISIRSTLSQLEFDKGGKTTYRRACQEGWAASPTNDVQRKIWTEVHTVPSSPIKIEK